MDDASMMDMDRTACCRAIATRDARFDGRLFVGVKTTGIYCRPETSPRSRILARRLIRGLAAI
jgi:methylphosphotriester-DNA--protein-cysteine methyltransferase